MESTPVKYAEIIDHISQKGIKTSFIANKLCMSRQYLYQVLNGVRPMPDKILERINSLLNSDFKHPEKNIPSEEPFAHEKLAEEKEKVKNLFKDK